MFNVNAHDDAPSRFPFKENPKKGCMHSVAHSGEQYFPILFELIRTIVVKWMQIFWIQTYIFDGRLKSSTYEAIYCCCKFFKKQFQSITTLFSKLSCKLKEHFSFHISLFITGRRWKVQNVIVNGKLFRSKRIKFNI